MQPAASADARNRFIVERLRRMTAPMPPSLCPSSLVQMLSAEYDGSSGAVREPTLDGGKPRVDVPERADRPSE